MKVIAPPKDLVITKDEQYKSKQGLAVFEWT